MRKILLVAYHFPPVGGLGAAGSQRMHKFSKHLPAFGWSPTVLTVKESAYEDYYKIDRSLMDEVSPELPIVRTGLFHLLAPLLRIKGALTGQRAQPSDSELSASSAPAIESNGTGKSRYQLFKDTITDLFEIPDEVAGWILPAVYRGARTIRKQKIDLILATGRPWTSLVVGAILKKFTGRPLVVDFRDPWMTNPFRTEHSSLKDKTESMMERWVVRTADLIVANTGHLRDEFVERFGSEYSNKCIAVLNGFDASEFDSVRAEVRTGEVKESFVLLHSGFLYGKRDPKAVIDAIGVLRDRGDLSSNRFRLDLVGSVELDYDLGSYISQEELQQFISLRGEVSYAESISAVAACDATLLLQPGTTTQIPSKVFEYIGLSKRILTVAPLNSSVSQLVKDNCLGVLADPDDVDSIADAIFAEFSSWESGGSRLVVDPNVRARFDVAKSVQNLSEAIERSVFKGISSVE